MRGPGVAGVVTPSLGDACVVLASALCGERQHIGCGHIVGGAVLPMPGDA